MWTPLQIEVAIHHITCRSRYQNAGTAVYGEAVERLVGAGILAYEDGILVGTAKGDAFLKMLCATPVPVTRYIDPRFPPAIAPCAGEGRGE